MGHGAWGERIVAARKRAGLTRKALADELNLPIWKVVRIERGELDPEPYLARLANVTGEPAVALRGPAEPVEPASEGAGATERAGARLARDFDRLVDELDRERSRRASLATELAQARRRIAEASARTREVEETLEELERGDPTPRSPARHGRKVSLHGATYEDLRNVGMSRTQATRTLHYRELGELTSVEQLDAVPGLPAKLRSRLKRVLRD